MSKRERIEEVFVKLRDSLGFAVCDCEQILLLRDAPEKTNTGIVIEWKNLLEGVITTINQSLKEFGETEKPDKSELLKAIEAGGIGPSAIIVLNNAAGELRGSGRRDGIGERYAKELEKFSEILFAAVAKAKENERSFSPQNS